MPAEEQTCLRTVLMPASAAAPIVLQMGQLTVDVLHLDAETARSLLTDLLSDGAEWTETLDTKLESHRMLEGVLSGLEYFSESLWNFRRRLD